MTNCAVYEKVWHTFPIFECFRVREIGKREDFRHSGEATRLFKGKWKLKGIMNGKIVSFEIWGETCVM